MAAMAAEGGSEAERLPMPSRNPLPLSASQEAQVRDIFYARVRKHCADEIKGALLPLPPSEPSVPSSISAQLQSPEAGPSSISRPAFPADQRPILCRLPPAFADCALGRTFTAAFACRETNRLMNGCMKTHATQEEQDAAREEWFAQRLQRQKERERKALRKAEQEAFLREWWGLPEKDREQARREMEKLQRGERIATVAKRNKGGQQEGLQEGR